MPNSGDIYPFQHPFGEVEANIDDFALAIIDSLESSFLAVPKGDGFVDYATFEKGYEALRRHTRGFDEISPARALAAFEETPICFVVLRTIMGFTAPEWAYVTSQRIGRSINQGTARGIDSKIRKNPLTPRRVTDTIKEMIEAACEVLAKGPADVGSAAIHRLDKADTKGGVSTIKAAARIGMPYAMLLYERLLGRPFATIRDANSELVGDVMEVPIEERLVKANVPYRKTKHAERIAGFEQAPDFIIPDEFSPKAVIEAKITEDDGTARDKVTRIQYLHTISQNRIADGQPGFDVIACIDGRGFGIRREDMKKIIRATNGKVFTLRTLEHLVDHTSIRDFRADGG